MYLHLRDSFLLTWAWLYFPERGEITARPPGFSPHQSLLPPPFSLRPYTHHFIPGPHWTQSSILTEEYLVPTVHTLLSPASWAVSMQKKKPTFTVSFIIRLGLQAATTQPQPESPEPPPSSWFPCTFWLVPSGSHWVHPHSWPDSLLPSTLHKLPHPSWSWNPTILSHLQGDLLSLEVPPPALTDHSFPRTLRTLLPKRLPSDPSSTPQPFFRPHHLPPGPQEASLGPIHPGSRLPHSSQILAPGETLPGSVSIEIGQSALLSHLPAPPSLSGQVLPHLPPSLSQECALTLQDEQSRGTSSCTTSYTDWSPPPGSPLHLPNTKVHGHQSTRHIPLQLITKQSAGAPFASPRRTSPGAESQL